MLVKIIIILLLLAVLVTLFTSATFLVKDGSDKRRVLTSLKIRVALSATLILFVLLSYFMGWIQPHGAHREPIRPAAEASP